MDYDLKTLLVSPPFSQLNTPYPATCYLTAYLKQEGLEVDQRDLGIIVIDRLFSKVGLTEIFKAKTTGRIGALKEQYINTISPVISFLRGQDPTLARRIVSGDYLPRSDRFDDMEEEQFGDMGVEDHGRYLATLYINDIGDYIRDNIDPGFGFSKYSERLALSPSSFDSIELELKKENSFISDLILTEWIKIITAESYDFIGITIPFPGNLLSTLLIAKKVKEIRPKTKVIIGGGWVNTELRSLTETRLFNYVDYVILDDGEAPLEQIIKGGPLNRTFILEDGKVVYKTNNSVIDKPLDKLPATDYSGLDLSLYISLLDSLNPMHSLWNRGRWNKMTLAHGCYWKRCAFCDTSLPYIRDYDHSNATIIADKMESIIAQTGETGFHFVDEAAPPVLLKELSLEILRRGLTVTWWTNIRFERHFTAGLAELMAKSGCIGLSGGVEVASDRLLHLMDKGVTVDQVTKVTAALGSKGIMVHAYLMYGFPTETEKETIDALEIVRQLFKLGLVQSAYWHQFSLTAHSSVGLNPEKFKLKIEGPDFKGFARNDLDFSSNDSDPSVFSEGLKTSLYNYMRGNGLDLPLSTWFKFPIPKTNIKKNYLKKIIEHTDIELKDSTQVIWLGEELTSDINGIYLYDNTSQERLDCPKNEIDFIKDLTDASIYKKRIRITLSDVDIIAEKWGIDADLWLSQSSAFTLYSYGLILI